LDRAAELGESGEQRDSGAAADDAEGPGGLREEYRHQLLTTLGGWSGTVIAAIPTVVFVVVNVLTNLRTAIFAAVGSAVVLAGYRLARRQSTLQALSGLVGVVVASLIAQRLGQARGYFLLGIWTSFLYAALFAASLLVRRPLVGLAWEFLDPSPDERQPWHRDRGLFRAYLLATLSGVALFAARGVVQFALFQKNATGWLAVARIAMGYPLYVLTLGYAFWVVRRARRRFAAR